jgi:membrane-bound lytic murein transglycosylase C
MGSTKITKIFLASILVLGLNSYAQSYEEFLKEQNSQFTQYQDTFEKEFAAYKKAHDEAFKEFSKALGKKWPEKKPVVSTKHKWVEYSKNLESRKSVDFEKKEVKFEVIAKSKEEASQKISKMFNTLVKQDVKTALKNDILEQKIAKKLKKPKPKTTSQQKIIADMINAQEKQRLKAKLKKQKLIVVKHKGKFIYKANIKLPAESTIRKARKFKSDVVKNSNKQQIPAQLVYAIMHSESSFNPMAKSHIPAYGLMQIVPRTAGVDSYKYLYGKKRVLRSGYLYDSSKNIRIGSAYLHILYYRYLKKIKDPQSKMYCTIAAYNTGAGNVAKAFTGKTNINKAARKINNMSSDQVYKTLMRKLPYNETKHYLKKVTNRASAYNKLLKTTL